MTAFPPPRRPGRRLGALAASFAWLLAGAALLLLAFVAAPRRLAQQPPLFWIGQVRPLPSPLTPSRAPGHGHPAPPSIRESQL